MHRGTERISYEGDSVTDDECPYLQALCDGPKRPAEIATELAESSAIATELTHDLSEGPHRAETVTDRLAYLAGGPGISSNTTATCSRSPTVGGQFFTGNTFPPGFNYASKSPVASEELWTDPPAILIK